VNPDPRAPSRPVRFQWTVVLVGQAAFALLALAVRHSGTPTSWEQPVLGASERIPFPIRDFLSALFEPIAFALVTIALAFAAAARGRTRLVVPGLGGCLAAVMTTELVLKPIVDRIRTHHIGLHGHVANIGGPMFPSAHVTAAAAWATFAWLIVDQRSRLKPFIVAVPLLVGWAVMSRHMHYPADVLGGLIVGPAVVYCTVSAVRATTRWVNAPVADRERERVGAAN
jgi:membrane-associated phospholipid phosphatase